MNDFVWEAVKEKKKGRSKSGFVIGIRKDGWKIMGEKEEGIILTEIGEENKGL